MSYREQFSTVVVTADNFDYWRAQTLPSTKLRIGDTMIVRHPPTKVDLRLFAQLAESLGYPYPDEP
jgi:hypothetical protein